MRVVVFCWFFQGNAVIRYELKGFNRDSYLFGVALGLLIR